jgi:hypothetical protein
MKNTLGYKITDKILINIAGIERLLATLNQGEVSQKSLRRLEIEGIFEDLFPISMHLKLGMNLGDIKKISLGKDIDQKPAKILSNIRQIFDYINNNFNNKTFSFNFQLVQHIVKLLQSGLLEVWDVSKIRTGPESVDKSLELRRQKYTENDLVNLFAEAIIWVDSDKEVHPIIKAVVFMMLINFNSPFIGYNYLSSLVFFRVILEKYGYGSIFNLPLFKILIQDKEGSFKKIVNRCLKEEKGLTELIEYITSKIYAVLNDFKDELLKFDYFEIRNNTSKIDLNERQLKLLKLLQQKVYIRRNEYVKLFKVSPMTAYRDLNYLAEKKLIAPKGQGKSTSYSLTSA